MSLKTRDIVGAPKPPGKSPQLISYLKGIFFFLASVIIISSLSSIFSLQQIIQREERVIGGQVRQAISALKRDWINGRMTDIAALDLAAAARTHGLTRIWLAVYDTASPNGFWLYREVDLKNTQVASPVKHRTTLPLGVGTATVGGVWQRSRTVATDWSGLAIVGGGSVAAPLLGALHTQMRTERWMRGLTILGFLVFTVLFYRTVLLPFHDMRNRAAALAKTGLLPPPPGGRDSDPEYVMATFDHLVTELLQQTEQLTERAVHSERHARNLERFNDYILSSLSTGVIILDRDGKVLRFNRAAEAILKLRAPDLVGQSYSETALPDPVCEVLRQGLETGRTYARGELHLDSSDSGPSRHLGINTSRILSDSGEPVGLSLLLTDLTSIKKLETEVAENKRMADLGELAAGLAHQLRNSIAAIFGYGRMIRGQLQADEPHVKWVDALIAEADETNEMIARFLEFARPLDVPRDTVDLLEIIESAALTLRAWLEDHDCVLRIPNHATDTPVLVAGDEVLLKQVFINLIQNASEAAPQQGQVTIQLEQAPRTPADRWTVLVSDNGGGIAPVDRERIFQPFFTTKETGTGLGLALARKIVGFHHGSLAIRETSASGTTFAVSLPAEHVGSTPNSDPTQAGETSRSPAVTTHRRG